MFLEDQRRFRQPPFNIACSVNNGEIAVNGIISAIQRMNLPENVSDQFVIGTQQRKENTYGDHMVWR